jgi:hypothetical protein
MKKWAKSSKKLEHFWKKNSDRFNRESKALNTAIKAEVEKNVKLNKTVKILWDKCFSFATQCIARLKSIFNYVGAVSKEVTLSAKDIPGALESVEKEIDVLDEVITGHSDFCALVASRGTVATFMKAGCNHVRAVNRPNFSLSPSDLVDISSRSSKHMQQIYHPNLGEGRTTVGWRQSSKPAQQSIENIFTFMLLFYIFPYHIPQYPCLYHSSG